MPADVRATVPRNAGFRRSLPHATRARAADRAAAHRPRYRPGPASSSRTSAAPPSHGSVPTLGGKHPFPARRAAQGVQDFLRRPTEQYASRTGLGIAQDQPVRLDFGPAQTAYLARPASGQQDQTHRRDAERRSFLQLPQHLAELHQIGGAKQPPARRRPVADDTGARIAVRFVPITPCDGAVEQAAQNVVTAVRATRLRASSLQAGAVRDYPQTIRQRQLLRPPARP